MANFTLTIPTTPVIRDIPNLGRVTFRPVVSIGVAMQASRASIDVTMAERATVFVNTVLAGALIDPKLQPDAIISLPEPTRTALIDALIDIWDIRTAVESTSADLPYDERIYQGYILYMAEMLKPIFTGFHSFMQNMQAQIRAIVRVQ